MPYLIDGHNLIPKLGLNLSSHDDEARLVEQLNQYCRLARVSQVEVYFDNGQPGQERKQKTGMVFVQFVRRPMIADEAIRLRLRGLKNAARNWTVVSSDQRVRAEARAHGAAWISSDEFAVKVMEALRSGPAAGAGREGGMNPQELEEWLRIFGEG